MANHRSGDADRPDQTMKVWLSERIVRLALFRCELSAIGEQIEALDQHADFLQSRGRAIPEVEQQQRETLEGVYLRKAEEVQRAFEPCASQPFSLEEEMNVYCQMLIEVNARLASQEHHPQEPTTKTPLRDLYGLSEQEPSRQHHNDEPDHSHEKTGRRNPEMSRKEELLQWKQETREHIDQLQKYDVTLRTVEGRLGQMRYNMNSQITHMAGSHQEYRDLQTQLRETRRAFKQDFPDVPATLGGIEKAIRRYKGIAAGIDRHLETLAQESDHEREHTTTTEAGWSELVQEAARRRAPDQQPPPQHTPHKRPLRDLYGPDTEQPRQRDEPDRSR